MSIDIDWSRLTSGSEGRDLAVSIRDFIHDKFQQITLPRFIRSVHVHAFEFGDQAPDVEIKDIGDPWKEFYEDEDGSDCDDEDLEERGNEHAIPNGQKGGSSSKHDGVEGGSSRMRRGNSRPEADGRRTKTMGMELKPEPLKTRFADTPANNFRFPMPIAPSGQNSPGFGIPGGTSNLSYFHLPLNHTGLRSGTHTPLPFSPAPWGPISTDQTRYYNGPPSPVRTHQPLHDMHHDPFDSLESRPRTHGPSRPTLAAVESVESFDTNEEAEDARSQDLQTTLHITYDGNLSLSLTAEILLDYPMPSFVGIPLALKITGMNFDGVALLAYMKARSRRQPTKTGKSTQAEVQGGDEEQSEDPESDGRGKCHFSFLTPEDAKLIIGIQDHSRADDHDPDTSSSAQDNKAQRPELGEAERKGLGALLREIKVETEIGRQENGKQVLKNVGKVEKFVLEQVRRIFEEEFVWPSFWTFLV